MMAAHFYKEYKRIYRHKRKRISMLFTYTSGEPTAPAIVFLHGGGLSGRMWQPQMERLTDYYCLAPDLPEQGKSIDVGPFQLVDAAKRVIEVIEEKIPSKRTHLVGLSLGADVALVLMHLAPQYIDHVMVSAAAPLGKSVGKVMVALATLPVNFWYLEGQVRLGAKMLGIPAEYRAIFCEDLLLSTNATSARHFVEALLELTPLLPCDTTIPTLVALGAQEGIIAKQAAKKVMACLPHARGIMAPKLKHVWSLQAPTLFTDTVRAWIEDQPLPSGLVPLL